MLERFGKYILENQRNACTLALVFGFVPLFGWVGVVIVALATLRHGPMDGFKVFLCAAIPDIIWALFGHQEAILFGILGSSFYVWIVASVLKRSASWTLVLEATALLAILSVVAVHLFMPDINSWWYDVFKTQYDKLNNEISTGLTVLSADDQDQWQQFSAMVKDSNLLQNAAKIATGGIIILTLLSNCLNLVLGRWWQASLFNPKALKPELLNVRLGYIASATAVFSIVGLIADWSVMWDIIPIVFLVFLVAGFSLIQYLFDKYKVHFLWILLFYVLFIYLSPGSLLFVVLIALIDSLFNVRQRLEPIVQT